MMRRRKRTCRTMIRMKRDNEEEKDNVQEDDKEEEQ